MGVKPNSSFDGTGTRKAHFSHVTYSERITSGFAILRVRARQTTEPVFRVRKNPRVFAENVKLSCYPITNHRKC